jgi:hypothetical protein
MNLFLWFLQILLAVVFVYVGQLKVFHYQEALHTMAWVGDLPKGLVLFIGMSELAGGMGMILPAATRVEPRLTGYAGMGLATIMLLALFFHAFRGEMDMMVPPVVLGVLAATVAYGRLVRMPIGSRTHWHLFHRHA